MPSTYAHRRFGTNVLEHLPDELRAQLEQNRELYDIGLHGPDLLFYYHAAKSNPVGALGNAMHEEPGRVFFDRARRVVHCEADRDAALAYALGFVCHFALDSTCHPYVEQFTRESGVTHCEIETEFDNMLLRRDGYTVAACGVAGEMDWDAAVAAEVVILPLPLCKEGDTLNIEGPRRGAGALFRLLRRDPLILAGQVKPAQAALAAELDLKLVDYFRREELTVANAAATAEGTVQVILERLERSLLGSRCLVLGFGRIGKLLCHRLTAMGARVTAAARRPESLAWARAYGYETADIGRLEGNLGAFDVVVNTVPEPVFGADRLRELKPDCLCVDVASVQGVDLNAAEALRLECIWARGLPGKLMPKTAGAVIRDTVYTIIKEQGVIL